MVNSDKKENLPNSIGIHVKDQCYYFLDSRGDVKISNFTMRVIFFIKSLNCPKRVIEVTNDQFQCLQFEIPADAMRNVDAFCKELESKGNYIFTGNKSHLSTLKELVFKDERLACDLPYLGYQRSYDLYAYSNGIFDCKGLFHVPDENGIVQIEGIYFYLPLSNKSVGVNEEFDFQNHKLFSHKYGSCSFETWASAFVCSYGTNGMIGIMYIISAIYRDIIFDQLHFMPHLFLSGKPQSGKSTFRRSLMQFFGDEQKPLQCGMGSTQKAFSRKFAQFSNALVSAEEYKNDIDFRLIETLKGIYDGEGYERAVKSNDNQTHSTSVLSSLIITGQQLPTKENALFSRCNLLEFSKSEYTNDDIEIHEKLKLVEVNGLTHLTGELFKWRKLIIKDFKSTFYQIESSIRRAFNNKLIADRIIKNYAAMITPFKILERNAAFNFNFLPVQYFDHIMEIISSQVEHLTATTELNQFWEIVKILIDRNDNGIHRYYHFRSINKVECIAIRFEGISDLYKHHCITRRISNGLDPRSLSSYLKKDKSFIKGKSNAGCHYFFIDGKKQSFFCFSLDDIGIDLREIRQEQQIPEIKF